MAAKAVLSPFSDIHVGWIGELVNQPNYRGISGEALIEYILDSNVPWKCTRTLDFDSVVEDSDMNIVRYAVVPIQCDRQDFV